MKIKFYGSGLVWNAGSNNTLLTFPKEGFVVTEDPVAIDILRRCKFREEPVVEDSAPVAPVDPAATQAPAHELENEQDVAPREPRPNADGLTPYVPKPRAKRAV